jgi:hypothetical protein
MIFLWAPIITNGERDGGPIDSAYSDFDGMNFMNIYENWVPWNNALCWRDIDPEYDSKKESNSHIKVTVVETSVCPEG